MDDVITRIVEIEQQCTAEVEKARLDYKNKIEGHKRFLEEKNIREHAAILSAENVKLIQSVEEAKRKIEAEAADFRRNSENLFQDESLNRKIKEDIISILLAG